MEDDAAAIGSSGLTPSQASGLENLLRNVAASDGTSSYVYSILDELVVHGGWSGISQTQFNTLIGQWFLGTDDPAPLAGSSMVSEAGSALFPANAATAYQALDQGYSNGDCWLVAALDETDAVDPAALTSMIWENANGSYGVRFCSPSGYVYVTVNADLMNGFESAYSTNGTIWGGLLEKAFVEAEADGITFSMEGEPSYGNDYQTVSNGGWDEMMEAITGRRTDYYQLSSETALTAGGSIYEKLLTDIAGGIGVMFDSNTDTSYGLESDHMFAVTGIDQSTGGYIMFNPWGYQETPNAQFEVTPAELYALYASNTGDEFLAADGRNYFTETALCMLAGTAIFTPAGERMIESLAIGDEVCTRFGGVQRIKWIGEQHYGRRFIAGNKDKIPVKIAAGALGNNMPVRDLYVSPGHSVFLDGILLVAKDLVNGVSITQGWVPEVVSYYNIELEAHDCVLAEGAWCETYADCAGMRAAFHNARDFFSRYPGQTAPAEPGLCAPRPRTGAVFSAVLARILRLAEARIEPGPVLGFVEQMDDEMTGWAFDPDHPELPVHLLVFAGGMLIGQCVAHEERVDVRDAGYGAGRSGFRYRLPARIYPSSVVFRRAATGAVLPLAGTFVLRRRLVGGGV